LKDGQSEPYSNLGFLWGDGYYCVAQSYVLVPSNKAASCCCILDFSQANIALVGSNCVLGFVFSFFLGVVRCTESKTPKQAWISTQEFWA
jgi:hypothetical protein